MNDPLIRMLADLPLAEPDFGRAVRLRSRCHAGLTRHRRDAVAPKRTHRASERLLAGLGGLYFAEIVRQTLQLYGVF